MCEAEEKWRRSPRFIREGSARFSAGGARCQLRVVVVSIFILCYISNTDLHLPSPPRITRAMSDHHYPQRRQPYRFPPSPHHSTVSQATLTPSIDTNLVYRDPNLVSWNSTTDVSNPINWSKGRKWSVVSVVTSCCLCVTCNSSIVVSEGYKDKRTKQSVVNDDCTHFIAVSYIH